MVCPCLAAILARLFYQNFGILDAVSRQAHPTSLENADELPWSDRKHEHRAGPVADSQRLPLEWPFWIAIGLHALKIDTDVGGRPAPMSIEFLERRGHLGGLRQSQIDQGHQTGRCRGAA
jgi:hypothetical protein